MKLCSPIVPCGPMIFQLANHTAAYSALHTNSHSGTLQMNSTEVLNLRVYLYVHVQCACEKSLKVHMLLKGNLITCNREV